MMMMTVESQQGPHEKRLLNQLFNASRYSNLQRPVRVEKDPLVVSFALVIQQIIDLVRLQYPTSPGELLLVNKADAL